MLSEREKRIIDIQGEIDFIKDTLEDLLLTNDPLDELEMELLRAAIERLQKLGELLQELKRGIN